MTLDKIQRELRKLINTVITEKVPLPLELLLDGTREARLDYQLLLARYHVQKMAEIVMNVQHGVAFDAELERGIRAWLNGELGARRGEPISIDCVVNAIFSAHLVHCPEFSEPLIDPIWLGSCAVAGLKDLVRDVLAEDRTLNGLQPAYVMNRNGEETLVLRDQLTHMERRTVRQEERARAELSCTKLEHMFKLT